MDNRRYDIDALRVLALGLLFLYHLGQFYVADWDWHIKSDVQSTFLQNLMIWSNQWRMSLLFLLSGMTLAVIEHKYTAGALHRLRLRRLGVPLLFGMAVIVPPQLYFELRDSIGYQGSYLAFLGEYFNLSTALAPHKQSPIGLLTWNHLWFLLYLLVYTQLYLLLRPLLRRIDFNRIPSAVLMVGAVTILITVWITLKATFPSTHGLVDDWYNHGKYFPVFLMGFALVKQQRLWQWAIEKRRWLLLWAGGMYALIIANQNGAFPEVDSLLQESLPFQIFVGVILATNIWGWIFTGLGYAGRYLNRPYAWIKSANEAVLPWYIFHQTLIIVFAVMLRGLHLPELLEAALILSLTVAGCALGYQLVKRRNVTRWLFGLGPRQPRDKTEVTANPQLSAR